MSAKFRIWAVYCPNQTPLAGRSGRWRVVNAYQDFMPNFTEGISAVRNLHANGKHFDTVLAFHATRFIRIGAFINPRREIGI
jgi:hypothetical protein